MRDRIAVGFGSAAHKYLILLAGVVLPLPAYAQPAQIIIARHAEKADAYALCSMGALRAEALAAQYLGRDAGQSLFDAGSGPDAMMAITLHTIESITPAARSWNMPVIAYTVTPKGGKGHAQEEEENRRTEEAAHDVLTEPLYAGKKVVMMWEHQRIASTKLEKKFPGEQVTLRQLLHLDRLTGVPEDWPAETYDYFWIVDLAPGNPVPVSFRMVRQAFTAPFDRLPANDWNQPEPLHKKAGCVP